MGHPCFSKGKDYFQRGDQFSPAHTMDIMENDFSKFDATQRPELLTKIELTFLKAFYPATYHEELELLHQAKLIKAGRTTNGVRFSFYGCRGSGDMDTGLFNTIINYLSLRYLQESNGLPRLTMAVDGDDSLMALPRGCVPRLTFHEFGLSAKVSIKHHWSDVEYCSAKFIEYAPGKFFLCPNLRKLFNTIGVCQNEKFAECLGQYYYSLGFMYKVMFPGVPIFSELSSFMMSGTSRPYYHREIIFSIRPDFVERDFRLAFDPELLLQRMLISFDIGREEWANVHEYLMTTRPAVGVDKRYNAPRTRSLALDPLHAELCDQNIKHGTHATATRLAAQLTRLQMRTVVDLRFNGRR
jgi:hypothetical protein